MSIWTEWCQWTRTEMGSQDNWGLRSQGVTEPGPAQTGSVDGWQIRQTKTNGGGAKGIIWIRREVWGAEGQNGQGEHVQVKFYKCLESLFLLNWVFFFWKTKYKCYSTCIVQGFVFYYFLTSLQLEATMWQM